MNISFKQIYKKSAVVATTLTLTFGGVAGGLLTSCSDYLDILPLSEVVLEKYWTQKSDVTSELMSCYESLASKESVKRMGIWGELRSDNIKIGTRGEYDVEEMLKENILPTSSLVKWDIMYQTINRCNTLIHYAPKVQELDPNYTHAEMNANIAEAKFIRALCYFHLIRTFRDVPVVFEPSIDDEKDYKTAPTPMNEALDILINDIDAVKDNAVRRYVDDSRIKDDNQFARDTYENSSRVTRVAMYALLADLNLWRGNWQKVSECCDFIINFKREQYKERLRFVDDLPGMQLINNVPLLREKVSGKCGNAFNLIFGTGNSFESIFELYYAQQKGAENSYVSECYGSANNSLGRFGSISDHCKGAAEGTCKLYSKNDCRVYENMYDNSGTIQITKYTLRSVSFTTDNLSNFSSLGYSSSRRSDNYANWIVYRLTDILLMKAEAEIMLGNYQEAFDCINTVNLRARNLEATAPEALKASNFINGKETMEKLLLEERNRELMFEGKRWYDLVRFALRDGNTKRLVEEATIKYVDNITAIKIKLADPNIIFLPYFREELKLNPYLKQNPAYGYTEEYDMN